MAVVELIHTAFPLFWSMGPHERRVNIAGAAAQARGKRRAKLAEGCIDAATSTRVPATCPHPATSRCAAWRSAPQHPSKRTLEGERPGQSIDCPHLAINCSYASLTNMPPRGPGSSGVDGVIGQ